VADRTAITLRLEPRLLDRIRKASGELGCSANAFLAQAAERAVASAEMDLSARRRAEHRRKIAERYGGPLPDSTPLIRELRDGRRHLWDDPDLPGQ